MVSITLISTKDEYKDKYKDRKTKIQKDNKTKRHLGNGLKEGRTRPASSNGWFPIILISTANTKDEYKDKKKKTKRQKWLVSYNLKLRYLNLNLKFRYLNLNLKFN